MSELNQNPFPSDPPHSLLDRLLKPAIWNVLRGTDGSYRCERDLHHHLTVCLEQIQPLRLGTRGRILRMEDPAVARYGTGRRGNVDFLIVQGGRTGSRREIALEVNWNYSSSGKIYKDICKLVDPSNRYSEALYFAFGTGDGFLEAVQAGLERAFGLLLKHYPQFALPSGFQIIVAEYKPGADKTVVYLAVVNSPCAPAQLEWHEQSKPLEISTMEETMEIINDNELRFQSETHPLGTVPRRGPSYQTAPLCDYSKHSRALAETLFSAFISRFPEARVDRYKGSYSVFLHSVPGTAAKIIIYEAGKGKVNGSWEVCEGVYILWRTNDAIGERVLSSLHTHGLKQEATTNETIAIAPAHRERFAFERVDDVTNERFQSILAACSEA